MKLRLIPYEKSETSENRTMIKSRTFQEVFKYDYGPLNANPSTITFVIISATNMKVTTKSIVLRTSSFAPSGLSSGFSSVKRMVENMIMKRMKGSNIGLNIIYASHFLIQF
jgi:hypothetical protein